MPRQLPPRMKNPNLPKKPGPDKYEYYLVHVIRKDNKDAMTRVISSARTVSVFLWGRKPEHWMIIKRNKTSGKAVVCEKLNPDISKLEKQLTEVQV